jgi:non-ribosomal peptide synthetase component F
MVNQLAHHLRGLGLVRDGCGLCLSARSSSLWPLGILKAGGAYLPLQPDYPPNGFET